MSKIKMKLKQVQNNLKTSFSKARIHEISGTSQPDPILRNQSTRNSLTEVTFRK